jgi:hypothetical protein
VRLSRMLPVFSNTLPQATPQWCKLRPVHTHEELSADGPLSDQGPLRKLPPAVPTPDGAAERARSQLGDPPARVGFATAVRRLVEEQCSPAVTVSQLEGVYERIVRRRSGAPLAEP